MTKRTRFQLAHAQGNRRDHRLRFPRCNRTAADLDVLRIEKEPEVYRVEGWDGESYRFYYGVHIEALFRCEARTFERGDLVLIQGRTLRVVHRIEGSSLYTARCYVTND